jgi:hypothetical protein
MPSLQNQIRSTSISQIFSDATWLTLTDSPTNDFTNVDYDDSSWSSAFIILPYALWKSVVKPVYQDPSALLLFRGDWIWTTEMNNTARLILPSTRPFQKKVMSPPGQIAVSANISISVDDTFTFFVNGKDIGSRPTEPNVGIQYFFPNVVMDPSVNVFAISATNLPVLGRPLGESNGSVLVGISMVYDEASVSSHAPTTSSDTSIPSAATSLNSVLNTALSVRAPFIITTESECLFISAERCYHCASGVAHKHFKFHRSFSFS